MTLNLILAERLKHVMNVMMYLIRTFFLLTKTKIINIAQNDHINICSVNLQSKLGKGLGQNADSVCSQPVHVCTKAGA